MKKFTKIELRKENFKFSCAHFTIFSATERENIHGHTFQVGAVIESEVGDNGMTLDYGLFKRDIEGICKSLNEHFLLPMNSPYLKINLENNEYIIDYADEKLRMLKRDVFELPVKNTTVEELSGWFLEELQKSLAKHQGYEVRKLEVSVFSGPGQSGTSTWEKV